MPELKVTQQHLKRDAYLYVRQSTPRQVLENTESTHTTTTVRSPGSLVLPATTSAASRNGLTFARSVPGMR